MKLISRLAIFTLSVLASLPTVTFAQEEPIRTKRSEFRIPFSFEKEEYARIGAQEVQLFLSMDRGETWLHVQSALPTSQKFRYKASQDGEHWFAVRTLDRERQLHPAGQLTPGLKVVVDRKNPEISMRLTEQAGGNVRAQWQITDADLDALTMRVEYNVEGTNQWVSAQFVPAPTGEALLAVPDSKPVTVRLGVRDRAGNVGVAERALKSRKLVSPRMPSGRATPVVSETIMQPSQPSLPAASRMPILPEKAPQPPALAGVPETPTVIPAPMAPITPPTPRVVAATMPAPPAVAATMPAPVVTMPASAVAPVTIPATPVSSVRTEPMSRTAYESQVPEMDPQQARIVNQLQFRLDYALDDLGPSGLGAVEVFITEDGGKKWWRYGVDADKQSPVILRVPRDGRYGFIIAAKSGVGIGDPPPAPGDAPQATVVVDRTPPKARFEKVGMSEDGHTLMVNWQTSDSNAHHKPVRLEYAETQQGPWTPMKAWMADTGEMHWDVPHGTPSRVYIRMLLRDAADNVGQIVYPQQVLVDMSRPRARITNVKISRPRR